jgi:type IV secretion system protein VirB10
MTEAFDAPPAEAPPAAGADRGISPIAGRFGLGRAGQAASVLALAAGCGVFLLATARHPHPKPAEAIAPAKQVVAFEPAPTLANPGPDAPSLTRDPSPSPEGPPRVTPDVSPREPVPAGRAGGDAPILAYSRRETSLRASEPAPAGQMVPAVASPGSAPARPRGAVGSARAARLPDRSFLILAGTAIPCVLQTAMDTATPGYVTCVTPADVWSENGAVVLLEKGTKVLGEYRGGLKQGQARLYVSWTRAVTPGGVAIDLASPATDALGRAGVDGEVDGHFWRRFGGAILFSILDGGLAAVGRAEGSVNFQAPSTTATTALQSSIDIPPTLRKAPGAEVAILVAQDLDFSGVYGVEAR